MVQKIQFGLECWTSTVRITVARTLAALGALVPTGALGHFLGCFAGLGVRIKHITFAAAKFVGLLIMVAREV